MAILEIPGAPPPAVDRQAQSAPNPDVVERFLLVVGGYRAGDIPITFLHRDLVAECVDQLITGRWRHAAELDRRAVGADRVDPGRLLVDEDPDNAVEIGQTLVIVIRVAYALDRLAGFIGGELEGAGPHDVLLVPARILVEVGLPVDPVERIGECRQERTGREFEAEHHGRGIGRLDLVDHQVVGGACAQHPRGRKGEVLPACRHILGGERRAVMEFDVRAYLESVGPVVVGRLRHLGAQIADDVGRRCRVCRIDPNEDAVVRRHRMHRRVGALAMSIKARRRVRRYQIGQRAAPLRRLLGACRDGRRGCEQGRKKARYE